MSGPHLKNVFEPMTIRGKQFRNRIVKTPQDMNFADFEDGTITQNYLDFYGTLAAGGVGGIIVEQSIVDAEGWREGTIAVFDDGCIPGLTQAGGGGARARLPHHPADQPSGSQRVLPAQRQASRTTRPGCRPP